ncbi:NAD/NADP transhydrogenase alpha subunit-like protein [Azospirillum isscasi]|uniref:NAD/NADP transhydrogenase alpha subunit-like protein n=1 Tax=Azospirillum isscasi TaxID=3053926 RepID=A0ABU0WN88_9PROT|nr:NAD/NADP transhydrogenase alpha subunit-like protein [Azospirillum isscasi]MDQ2105708.1 NAD/NADP transhydrogenase alpha subunit-like protein [Azospirillum isscasi]
MSAKEMRMRNFRIYGDAMGAPSDILDVSDSRHVIVLAAGVGKTVTVPAEAMAVLFNATGPFWVQYGGAAALPVADDGGGSAPELAPAARRVQAGETIGLIAPFACTVSLSFYGVRP